MFRCLTPLLYVASVGCTAGPGTDPTDSDSDTELNDAEVEPVEPLDDATLAQLELSIETYAAWLIQLDEAPIAAFLDTMSSFEHSSCPPKIHDDQGWSWNQDGGVRVDCTTPAGVRFFGSARFDYRGWEDVFESNYRPRLFNVWGASLVSDYDPADTSSPELVGRSFLANLAVNNALDEPLQADGSFTDLRMTWQGITLHRLERTGPLVAPASVLGPGSWPTSSIRPSIRFTQLEAGGGFVRQVDGAIDGMDGDFPTVGLFDGRSLSAGTGAACPEEPSGVFSARHADGTWYDVVFDGTSSPTDPVDPALCDGCGVVTLSGIVVGTACPDLSGLLEPFVPETL